MKFNLKRPCKDCPFIKDTPMVLRPGRMQSIAKSLDSDHAVFPCHKTTEHGADGEVVPRHNESACMGALAYQRKHGKGGLPVLARIALSTRLLSIKDVEESAKQIERPGKWKTD